jgi:hypothetical protein
MRESDHPPGFDGGGGGGYDGGMEKRIDNLEKDMSDVKSDVVVMKSNYVTKADLHESVNSLIKWIVGTAVALGAAAITIMTFVLNNAAPKPASAQQPIVIYAQPAPVAPAPAPVSPKQ